MTEQRFLFVYPEVPETYWSFKQTLRFIGKKALMLPLGIATIAGMVGKGYSLSAVDLNVSPLKDAQIQEADLVLISAMLVQKPSFFEVIRRCKQFGKRVAVGGPYPTACMEELRNLPLEIKPDFLILDEGEVTFPRFLTDWEMGAPKEVYRSNEKPSLDVSPLPRFDLFNLAAYNVLPLQFSRGCPFDCEFCDIVHLFGRIPRTKSPSRFLLELETALSLGFKGNIFVVDDNFIGNRKKVKSLLRTLIPWQEAHGHPVNFSTEASVDLSKDEELLDLMVQAGFNMVFVGLETPVQHSLQEAGKVQNLQIDLIEGVRKIQSRGIEVTGGFILGFDSDPEDVASHQISFIESLAIPTAMVGLLTALPGTRLYKRLLQEGRILTTASGNNTHLLHMNFTPKQPLQRLLTAYKKILGDLYKPSRYFKRCLELLSRIPSPSSPTGPKGRRTLSIYNISILFRSVIRQTFSWYGGSYLSFLIKALRRHPDKIVQIIGFTVQGHHLFHITRQILQGKTNQSGMYRSD